MLFRCSLLIFLCSTSGLFLLSGLGLVLFNKWLACKAPVKSSPPTNPHPVLLVWMALLWPNQQCQEHWRWNITFRGLVHSRPSPRVLKACLWSLRAPGTLGDPAKPLVSPLTPVTPVRSNLIKWSKEDIELLFWWKTHFAANIFGPYKFIVTSKKQIKTLAE